MKHALNLTMLVLIALCVYACRKTNQLPAYARFPDITRQVPRQIPTQRPPFTVKAADTTHTVTPLYEYQIAGMVVSCGFSKNLAAHRNDYLNVMDVGIIWGRNLDPSLDRQVDFENDGVWLRAATKDLAVWKRLDPTQLSNNHLLGDDTGLKKRIRNLKRGDLIRIQGCLVSYSGRNSSVIRTDSGGSACEIIWVEELEILQDGNRDWRRLHRASLFGSAVLLVARAVHFFFRTPGGYHD